MKQQKRVVFTLVLVVMAFMALSVSTVMADSGHAPVCQKGIVKGIHTLECVDVDGDIAAVEVKANTKYDLRWNGSRVVLRAVVNSDADTVAWVVKDKGGHAVEGSLP